MFDVDTDTRVGRQLAGMIASDNRGAKVRVTVSLYTETERRYHETFDIRRWVNRDGEPMLTVSVTNSGDWNAGVKPISVMHVNASTGDEWFARDDRNGDRLLRYAAAQALRYARTGLVSDPANGRVEAVESELCGRCGRELTHPDSIALGIGPECAGRETHGETITGRRKARPAARREDGPQTVDPDGCDVFGAPLGGHRCDYCDRPATGGCFGFHACPAHSGRAAHDGRKAYLDAEVERAIVDDERRANGVDVDSPTVADLLRERAGDARMYDDVYGDAA